MEKSYDLIKFVPEIFYGFDMGVMLLSKELYFILLFKHLFLQKYKNTTDLHVLTLYSAVSRVQSSCPNRSKGEPGMGVHSVSLTGLHFNLESGLTPGC